jgi:hypothetical protein
MFAGSGNVYYLLSPLATVNAGQIYAANTTAITAVRQTLEGITVDPANRNQPFFIHFVTYSNGLFSEIITHQIQLEEIHLISTTDQFNTMLRIGGATIGRRYYLQNDLDFTGVELPQLDSGHEFMGVFNGNGFTLDNLTMNKARGGIFSAITNGIVRNFIVDNAYMNVDETATFPDPENPNDVVMIRVTDDAGLIAANIRDWGLIENISVRNSEMFTTSNYSGIFLGRVRRGVAVLNNLSIVNTSIITTESMEYLAGFVGGGDDLTEIHMNNIYANGLRVEMAYVGAGGNAAAGQQVVGLLISRIRSIVTINNVVIRNTELVAVHNVGLIAGVEDFNVPIGGVQINNVLIDSSLELIRQSNGNFTASFAYVYGVSRLNNGLTSVITNMFVVEIPLITNGIPGGGFPNNSAVQGPVTIINRTDINQSWFETNLNTVVNNSLWTIVNGELVLANSI